MTENLETTQVFTPEKHSFDQVPGAPASYAAPADTTVMNPTPTPEYAAQPAVVTEPSKKHHGCLIALIIVLVIFAALGIFAFTQYKAAMRVVDQLTAEGNTVAECVTTITESVKDMDFDTALASAKLLDETAAHMRETISKKEFSVASLVPKYGKDVLTTRTLLDIVLDVDEQAAIPLLQAAADNPIEDMYSSKTGFDTESLYALVDAVDAAFPVGEADLKALSELDTFNIPQLQEDLAPLFDNLGSISASFEGIVDTWAEYRPKVDELVGRDGSGVVPKVLSLVGSLLGDGADELYSCIVAYAKSMITGKQYVPQVSSSGIDWTPLIELMFGQGDAEDVDWLAIIMQIINNANSGEEGGMDFFSILGLLFGSGDDEPGIFSLLAPLLGGGDGDSSDDGGFDFQDIFGLLFGGEDDSDASSSDENSGIPDITGEGDGDDDGFGIFDIFGLLFGGDDTDDGDSGDDGDLGFDIGSLLELLLGDTTITVDEPSYVS